MHRSATATGERRSYRDVLVRSLTEAQRAAIVREPIKVPELPQPLQMAMPPGTRCAWFAGCQNEATHIEAHPVLTGVPACDRCPTIGR